MLIHPQRMVLSVIACVSLLAACGSGASTAGPSAAATSTTTPTTPPASAPTPAASAAVAATATPDLAHPVGMIAIGHSGLTGQGTGVSDEAVPDNSWATGTSPAVDSVYLRLAATRPETEGQVANTAQGGALADILAPQAKQALRTVPVPALAIISTIDNDIRCDGTDATHTVEFGKSVQAALDTIVAASPNVRILIVGQLGRPRADFIEALVATHPSIKAGLMGSDMCSFYDTNGNVSKTGLANLTAIIQGYEDEQARVCKLYPQCRTDGGVRAAWIDKVEYFSPDFAHLNVTGQAAEAANIWPVVKKLMGL
jgi:hypothetical protein